MPLSFASILGGLGIFEVNPVGLPVAIVGVIVMIGVVPRLLRERTSAGDSMRATARTFQIQMVVEPAGPLVDTTIEQAQLRDLDGLFLAAIERGRVVLIVARPDIARAAVLSRASGARCVLHERTYVTPVELHETVSFPERVLVGAGRAAEDLQSAAPEIEGPLAGVVEQHPTDPRGTELLGDVHRNDLGRAPTAVMDVTERQQLDQGRDLSVVFGDE